MSPTLMGSKMVEVVVVVGLNDINLHLFTSIIHIHRLTK